MADQSLAAVRSDDGPTTDAEPTLASEVPTTEQEVVRARFGSFAILVEESKEHEELARALREALNEDPRVVSLDPPNLEPEYCTRLRVYPSERVHEADRLVMGLDFESAFRFSEPFRFMVHAPRKNQPVFKTSEEAPTEDYAVAWNGYSLVVAWKQAEDEMQRPGGHVVADVLEQAANKLDGRLYIESCHPECTHLFVHQTMRVLGDPEAESAVFAGADVQLAAVNVIVPDASDLEEVAEEIFYACASPGEHFAQMKNNGRRVLDIERVARADLDELMALHYYRASLRSRGLRARIAGTRALWGWRTASRLLLARLWLALAEMERLGRVWDEERGYFERFSAQSGVSDLFELDHLDDEAALDSLDLGLVKSALEEVGSRLDTSAVVLATASAAVAALLGVLVGYLLG